ncbi:Scr1 family TA system antitoxin-like transcriptional regulator [Embleya sp. NBC_00896]|uniref:helix-turn-helix domain-containing protein n=1 Tax=Embleya sp. NBC_00896 TaxID=2975961 RepID=UPI0038644511|nr:helix-turn-helix transcriptional regulator [Embleya sp. NBC_00896]
MVFRGRSLDPGAGPRHAYGAGIRALREGAGMSLADLAAKVGYDRTILSRFETAERPIPEELAPLLDAAFGTHGLFVAMYETIRDDVFPDWVREFVNREAQAIRMRKYSSAMVPGLLQTRAYALAVIRAGRPRDAAEEVEAAVDARMSRQSLLDKQDPPHLWAVLDEAVLRRTVGSRTITCEQLKQLLAVAERPNVVLEVLPFNSGAHAFIGGSLTLLTQADGARCAYMESSHTGQLFEEPNVVDAYELSYDHLRTHALSPRESAAMIAAAMKEYQKCELPPS